MKISFVVCGNGYGHIKRVIQVIDDILFKNTQCSIQVVISSSHEKIVNDWSKRNIDKKKQITFVNGFTERNLGNNLPDNYSLAGYKQSLSIIERQVKEFNPEKVISDNLVGLSDSFPQVILMGSFLWSDILNSNANNDDVKRICEFENLLLQKHKPLMIGVEDMAMDFVKKETSFTGLPWFCERAINTKGKRQKVNILITGGGTSSLTKELLEIANALIAKIEVTILLDDKLYQASDRNGDFEVFSFTHQDFCSLDWIICRPGIGILNDAVRYGIPVCALTEGNNREIQHNAKRVGDLGIGIIHEDISCTEKSILNSDTRNFRDALCLLQTGGAAMAAEIILNR